MTQVADKEGKILVFINPHYWVNPEEHKEAKKVQEAQKAQLEIQDRTLDSLKKDFEDTRATLRALESEARGIKEARAKPGEARGREAERPAEGEARQRRPASSSSGGR